MQTTLNKIRACHPCGIDPRDEVKTGYQKLVAAMGDGFSIDAPITITQILDSNGLDDALCCAYQTNPKSEMTTHTTLVVSFKEAEAFVTYKENLK